MKQIDVFSDKDFQSLDLTKKQTIATNYFDREMADEEFLKLDTQKQSQIKDNFVNAQLNFDVSDTLEKGVSAIKDAFAPAYKVDANITDPALHDAVAPNRDGSLPTQTQTTATITKPFMIDALPPEMVESDDVMATRAFKPAEQTAAEIFKGFTAPILSPEEQDTQAIEANKQLISMGKNQDYINPEASDWELGKRVVNRVNELTANAVQGTYNLLGNIKTPMEYLGITTEAMDAQNKKRADWFKDASDKLNDFVYEKNKMQINDDFFQRPTHSWQEVKKGFSSGGVFDVDAWQELGNYVGSEGTVSVPDMAEMVAAMPLYYAARQQESAEHRAKNNNRKEPTANDYLMTAPTTMGSIILDRLGLKATTEDVVKNIGKQALDGSLKEAMAVVGTQMKKGFVTEGFTESLQNPLEKFGEEIGTKKGLSSGAEYADDALAGFTAGAGAGAGISSTTATGTEIFNTISQAKQEKVRDAYAQDTYNKQMMGSSLEMQASVAPIDVFAQNLDAKIKTIQSEFQNLVINHPEQVMPVEAVDSVEMQEQIVADAKTNGLNVSDNNGLNQIDVGWSELQVELSNTPLSVDEELKPKGFEDATAQVESIKAKSPYSKKEVGIADLAKAGYALEDDGKTISHPTLLSHGQFILDNEAELEYFKSEQAKLAQNAEPKPIIEKPVIGEPEPEAKADVTDINVGDIKENPDAVLHAEDAIAEKVETKRQEVLFKPNKNYSRGIRGEMFDLPYGEKGVIVYAKDGGATLFEYKTATQLGYHYPKNNIEDSIQEARNRLENKFTKESLQEGMKTLEGDGKLYNPTIIYAKEKKEADATAAKKGQVEFEINLPYSNTTKTAYGYPVKLAQNLDGFVYQVLPTSWSVIEKRSGMLIAGSKTRTEAIANANAAILKNGERIHKTIEITEKSFNIAKAKYDAIEAFYDLYNNEKTDVLKEIYQSSNLSDDKIEEILQTDLSNTLLGAITEKYIENNNTFSKFKKSDIIKQEVQDNANTRDDTSGGDVDKAGSTAGIPTSKQNTLDTKTNQGSDKSVSEGDRRPDGLSANGSPQNEVSNGYGGVDGYKTDGGNKQLEQQATDANGVLSKSDKPNSTENYSLEGRTPVELTRGQRKKFNDATLEIIKKPLEEITEADREVLRHYTGEGGLGEANENSVNQHYTNYETVQSIYKALADADIPMDKILEPAVGSGNFVGFMPNASWDVVDIDTTNIEITKRLYPQIKNFYADTYETFQGKNYDLIISNVPFASTEMLMREHAMTIKPAFKAIHNFYFAHSMDKVKENGVIAFMTSTGTMDGTTTARQLRKYLMDRGDIIGAFRLPEKSQAKNAHTDTMIDIIFIQKRPEGVKSRQEDVNNQFVSIGNKDGFAMNEYLIQHPESLLGDEVVVANDKTKMGTEGWIVRGEPKFENIKISYEPYKIAKKTQEEQHSFKNVEEATEYAAQNKIPMKLVSEAKPHSDFTDGKMVYYAQELSFSDTSKKAMFGEVLKGDNTQKALLLEKIKTLTEDGLRLEDKSMLDIALAEIQNYKSKFEKSPHNDLALKKFMKEHRADIALKESMSYFDKDFTPAPIYGEQTRFKDSGTLEVDENSPLIERALFYSTGDTVIDTLKEYDHLSKEDMQELVKNRSYVRSGVNEIQLDFMYYSGNVYAKLDLVEGLRKYHGLNIDEYNEQYAKLKAIIPEQIPFKNITVKGGESWLPNAIRNAISTEKSGELFVRSDVFDGDGTKAELYNRYLNKKALVPKGKDESDQENIQRTMEATKLLSEVLVPQVMRYIEKQGLAEILTDEYNKYSNFYVRPEMTGVLLRELPRTFRGKPFTMQSHQLQGAEKLVFNKKGVLAFAPGGGKTITAIVAVMNLIGQGVMKKPLFVVPVNTIAQWENSVKELYPNASVFEFPKVKSGANKGNAKEWTQLSREEKEQMAFDLANNRYDFTIIGDTMFQKFGLPSDVMSEYVDDLVEQIQAIEEVEAEDTKSKKKGVSAEAKKRALKNGLKQAYGSDVEFDFAKMGFDGLIADEVQYYKNIGLGGKDIKGGLGASVAMSYSDKNGNALTAKDIADGAEPHSATLGSMRSYDFRFKSKYVSKNNNGNNVVLLTGTPTPNKPLELYTLLQHLDESILFEYGIISSKDFVDTFYDIEEFETTDSTGKIVKREALASMKNLDWMGKILDRFVDYKGFKDMPELPRPKQVDTQHYLKLSKAGEQIFGDVQHRILTAMDDAKKIKSGLLDSNEVEIALVAMGAGRSASIDLRLYDVGTKGKSQFTPDELFDIIENDIATSENNKILKTIELLTNQYKENSNSGQIIFLDRLSVKNSDGSVTSTHAEMRDKILATGLFSDTEVVFVNGAAFVNPTTGKVSKSSIKPDMLNKIMDMYNDGSIKVIIGNTSKLGVGVDLNRKTTDIYQLDIPFRPDEIEQRDNRGVRQGNENEFVRTHQFFQLGTFDKRSYDIVMKKRGFNDMYGFSENEDLVVVDGVSIIDNSNTTDPYQAVIDLERDPFERERLRKQRVIENAVVDANNFKNIINKLEADVKTKQGSVKNYHDAIKGIDENLMPQNFPKYEAIKDAAEKKEKLDKHIQGLVERKAKYENTIQGIEVEIAEIEAKASERKEQKASHEAETKFITDEFTNDGKNVSIDKIKAAYTLEQILKSEGKSAVEIKSYMEDEGDDDFSDNYMKSPAKKPNFAIVGEPKNISKNETQIHITNELRDLANINDKPIIAYLAELLKKHPESFKSEKDVFKHIIDVKNSASFIMQGSNPNNTMIVKSVNGITKKIGVEKNNDEINLLVHALISTRTNELKRLIRKQLERSPTLSLHDVDTANGANALLTASDNISLSKEEEQSQEETNLYARANGYDEAGINYVPNYSVSGIPSRPLSDTITLGKREVKLPAADKPINADSLRVYVSDIIGNRLYDGKIKGKSALGIYKRKDSSIRLENYSDVEIMAHEMAHYLDFFHNNKSKDAKDSFFRGIILKNKDEVKALSYTTDPKKELSEGFAEFVRLWLTNYNTLTLVAPNMIKDFEARLAKDKNLQSKMEMLQTGMHQFYYQGAAATLRSKQGGELNSTAKKIQRSQAEISKDIRQAAIDKIHSIKRIEAAIRGDIATDAMQSPYKILQLAEHASSLMHTAMHFGVPSVKANGDITYGGKALNDIFAPATKVSEERVKLLSDYLVAMRASELKGQGRENLITEQEIEAGLLLAQKYPEFETILNEYQEFNDAMLDFYVGMNLITPEQKENFQEMNKNYVPFHRVTESVQNGAVPAAKIGQRLTGGTHSLGNIMENIVNGLESNIKQALISRGKSVFFKMLDDSGMGGVFATKVSAENKLVKSDIAQQAKKVAQLMAQLGITVAKDGMILSGDIHADIIIDVNEIEQNLLDNPSALEFWTHGHKPTSQTGYIETVIINGKKTYFEVHDAGLVDSLTSFGNANYNEFVQGLMMAKNVMTWNITNNPLFYLTNFARDTVSASVLSKNKFIPVMTSVSGMYHFVMKTDVYKNFMASGGGYGTRRTTLGGDVDAMGMLEVNRGFEVLDKLLSGLAYGADTFEYGTRVGEFLLATKAGKSNMQSAFEGNEVSTDFTIKGSNRAWTGFLATVPFMKAGINGMDKTARRIFSLNGEMKLSNAVKFRNQLGELQAHKLKLYITGGIISLVTLALWSANKDDERYKKLTRDSKLMYWHFFIGDQHIKIPRPYDIGFAFATIPEIIADGIYTKHGKKAAMDFAWGVKTMFSIGDVSGLFQPVLEHMTNKNWTGGDIIPSYLENIDDKSDQYMNFTPLLYKKAGALTGTSPIMIQHYVDGYLGLTAKMVEEATENMLWNEKEWGARPFERNALEFLTYRFRGKEVDPRTAHSEKYYELMEKAGGVKASFEAKKKKAFLDDGKNITEYMSADEKKAYIQVSRLMARYANTLTDIKNGVEYITYDKKLSKAEKEKRINAAYEKRTEIFKGVSETLDKELKKFEDK